MDKSVPKQTDRTPDRFRLLVLALAATALAGSAAADSLRCVNDAPNPYKTLESWPVLAAGRVMGQNSGIAIGPDGNIWSAERCGGTTCAGSDLNPVQEFSTDGRLLKAFGAGLLVQPHGITVDEQGDVWVTDAGAVEGKGEQAIKFSPSGDVLLRLGKAGVAGSSLDAFDQPTAVAIAPSGEIFVSEGHAPTNGNSRIMKFSPKGDFLGQFGRRGSAPGEFLGPHGLAFDSRGRLFVADRGNNRIQIFSAEGRFLEAWPQFGAPGGIFIDAHDRLYVADSSSNETTNPGCRRGIRVGSAKDGRVSAFIPDPLPQGGTSGAEGVTADSTGAVYGAEVAGRRIQKYVPMP